MSPLRYRDEPPYIYAEDEDESPSRSALYLAIGAAAGFAAGVLMAERFGVFLGQNSEVAALSERRVQVQNFTINFDRDRVAQQSRPYGCYNVARQSAFGSFTGGAVGEPQRQHFLV